jgi:hypothetical protein
VEAADSLPDVGFAHRAARDSLRSLDGGRRAKVSVRPEESSDAGGFAGVARRVASMRPSSATTSSRADANSANSMGAVLRRRAIAETRAARQSMATEMPRWKRPASECGHGSSAATISRPSSESVQARFAGQALQTVARAR